MKHRGAKLTYMPTLEYDTVIASMVHLHGSRITSQPYLLISYKNIYNTTREFCFMRGKQEMLLEKSLSLSKTAHQGFRTWNGGLAPLLLPAEDDEFDAKNLIYKAYYVCIITQRTTAGLLLKDMHIQCVLHGDNNDC